MNHIRTYEEAPGLRMNPVLSFSKHDAKNAVTALKGKTSSVSIAGKNLMVKKK